MNKVQANPDKMKAFSLVLSPELLAALKSRAATLGVTTPFLIRVILAGYINKEHDGESCD